MAGRSLPQKKSDKLPFGTMAARTENIGTEYAKNYRKEGGMDVSGKQRKGRAEKKRAAAVLSPENETERIYPACYNKIREVRVAMPGLWVKRYASQVCLFFLHKKLGRYLFSGLVHGREAYRMVMKNSSCL